MNEALRKAREDAGYTQAAIAAAMGTTEKTYYEWEHNNRLPMFENRKQLARALGMALPEVNALFQKRAHSATMTQSGECIDIIQYATDHLSLRLLSVIDARGYLTQREKFALILEEFDAMSISTDSTVTRRDAVIQLATLPFALPPFSLMVRKTAIPPLHYEQFLDTCGASLVACEEILFTGSGADCKIAFEAVSRYLAELDMIIGESSRYRKRAGELASIAAILKINFAHPVKGSLAAIPIALDALRRCNDTESLEWVLSARTKLSWAYLLADQKEMALSTARDARNQMEADRGKELPISIQGSIYSVLAMALARNELSPDTALRKAQERYATGASYLLNFGEENMRLEQGNALSYTQDTRSAIDTYAQIVNPETLQPTTRFQGIARGYHLQIVEGLTRSATTGNARDMSHAIQCWQVAMEGAKAMGSESKYQRMSALYDLMKVSFPGERQVLTLRDHLKKH